MKLSIILTEDHTFYEHGQQKRTARERVNLTDATGPAFVIAGFLRAIADNIDPAAIKFERQDGLRKVRDGL